MDSPPLLLFIFISPLNFVSIRSSADLTLFSRMVNMQAFRSLLLLLAPGVVNGAVVVNGEYLFVSFLFLVWLRVLAQQPTVLLGILRGRCGVQTRYPTMTALEISATTSHEVFGLCCRSAS